MNISNVLRNLALKKVNLCEICKHRNTEACQACHIYYSRFEWKGDYIHEKTQKNNV